MLKVIKIIGLLALKPRRIYDIHYLWSLSLYLSFFYVSLKSDIEKRTRKKNLSRKKKTILPTLEGNPGYAPVLGSHESGVKNTR